MMYKTIMHKKFSIKQLKPVRSKCWFFLGAFIFVFFISCDDNSTPSIAFTKLNATQNNGIPLYLFEGKPYTGYVFHLDKDSILLADFNLDQGLISGNYTRYFPNGSIKQVSGFVKGKRQGKDELFYSSGKIRVRRNYIKGRKQGKQYHFFDNGNLDKELYFDQGVIKGQNVFFYPDGKLRQKMQFNANGIPDGTWEWFKSNGTLLRRETYRTGELITFE